MSLLTAIAAEASFRSIEKDASCECCVRAVESAKQTRYKMVNSNAYLGMVTSEQI